MDIAAMFEGQGWFAIAGQIVLTKQDLDSLERNMEMVVAHLITKGKND